MSDLPPAIYNDPVWPVIKMMRSRVSEGLRFTTDDLEILTKLLVAGAAMRDGLLQEDDGTYEVWSHLPIFIGVEGWDNAVKDFK